MRKHAIKISKKLLKKEEKFLEKCGKHQTGPGYISRPKFIEILKDLLDDDLVKECGLSLCVMISQESGELDNIIYELALAYGADAESLDESGLKKKELMEEDVVSPVFDDHEKEELAAVLYKQLNEHSDHLNRNDESRDKSVKSLKSMESEKSM